MRIRYHVSSPPARGTGAFLPRPVGGGHATPASTTHGIVEVFAGKLMPVKSPRPTAMNFAVSPGSTVNSNGGPQYIRPDRYVTTAHGMGPKVRYSPLQPAPIPVPARQEVALASLASRRAAMGGAVEKTPWPKSWQSYLRKGKS